MESWSVSAQEESTDELHLFRNRSRFNDCPYGECLVFHIGKNMLTVPKKAPKMSFKLSTSTLTSVTLFFIRILMNLNADADHIPQEEGSVVKCSLELRAKLVTLLQSPSLRNPPIGKFLTIQKNDPAYLPRRSYCFSFAVRLIVTCQLQARAREEKADKQQAIISIFTRSALLLLCTARQFYFWLNSRPASFFY